MSIQRAGSAPKTLSALKTGGGAPAAKSQKVANFVTKGTPIQVSAEPAPLDASKVRLAPVGTGAAAAPKATNPALAVKEAQVAKTGPTRLDRAAAAFGKVDYMAVGRSAFPAMSFEFILDPVSFTERADGLFDVELDRVPFLGGSAVERATVTLDLLPNG